MPPRARIPGHEPAMVYKQTDNVGEVAENFQSPDL